MTKEESLAVSAHIGGVIAEYSPKLSFTEEELREAKESFGEALLRDLTDEGYYRGDFELFYTMFRFCGGMDLWKRADEAYLKKLFASAKKMDRKHFLQDPYLKTIRIPEKAMGEVLLCNSFYEKGEFFQYDMPDLTEDLVVPRIGFFSQRTPFPAVYEGRIPWVSVCPSEIHSMSLDLSAARGRCLVLGLGLGYYPFRISFYPQVEQIVVVEKNPQIIALFSKEILPQFPYREKIRIIEDDAFSFLEACCVGEYDFCYADIWEGWEDGASCYARIKPQEKRLVGTVFRYWIEKEILWYMKNA